MFKVFQALEYSGNWSGQIRVSTQLGFSVLPADLRLELTAPPFQLLTVPLYLSLYVLYLVLFLLLLILLFLPFLPLLLPIDSVK